MLHFLNGEVVALPKDNELVTSLYEHLSNLEVIRRSLDLISMRAAGFTSVHKKEKEALLHAAINERCESSLRRTAFILLLGALFSLSSESLQYFLESRTSSMMDVVDNTIGTTMGITIDKSRSILIKVARRVSTG